MFFFSFRVADDNFVTIVSAVKLGRAIYGNIQKFVMYLTAVSAVEVLLVFVCVAAKLPLPLMPLAVLFINLVNIGLSSVALALEQGESVLMTFPPRDASEPIIHGIHLASLLVHALALAVVLVLNFLMGLWWFTGQLLRQPRR